MAEDQGTVLIVEDESHLAKGLQFNLEAEGHSVAVVGDGERALDLLLGRSGEPTEFDAVVLDVMLPGKDGFAVATELRAAKQFVPVLMLTARGRPEDVLKGFASGADDYLSKPFELPILLARLQGLLRRREWMRQGPAAKAAATVEYEAFSFHGRTIDFGKLELRVNGNTIQLTLMEAELLRHLIRIRDGSSPASRFSKKCGGCTKTPTLEPSIISSFACGATSKTTPPNHDICSRFAAWAIASSRSRKRSKAQA